MAPGRFALAKDHLLADLEAVIRDLGIDARKAGSVYECRSPARADRLRGSFVIWATGPAKGGWRDFATDEKGDVFGLIGLAKGLSMMEALAWAEDRYGLKRMSEAERRAFAARVAVKRERAAATAAATDAARVARAVRLFGEASPDLRGTPAETYLAVERGVPLADMPGLEAQSFRFHRGLEWWMGAETDPRSGRRRPGPIFPALISAMVDAAGAIRAVHCTFLAHDGQGKAPVAKPKLMYPATSGLIVRLARGDGGMTPEAAAAAGLSAPVILCEGLEDGGSYAVATPEYRVWMAGSLPGLLTVPDHPCASAWLVARDNDWGKRQAAALFARALDRLRDTGKPVETISIPGRKDANDWMRRV